MTGQRLNLKTERNMNTISTRSTALALLGLLALAVYILACTSFSPDDSQVLYPAFDESGAIGLAVYNREARRSDMLFVPAGYGGDSTNAEAIPVRGQWLADGKRVLVAWGGGDNQPDHQLQLAVVPAGARSAFKVFTLADVKEPGTLLMQPLPVAGDQLFVMAAKDKVVRLNLKSGAIVRHDFADLDGELALYPNPASDGVFYVLSRPGTNSPPVFGRLDPERFTLTPLAALTNETANGTFFTYDRQGSRIAFVTAGASNTLDLVVLKDGKPEIRRPIGSTDRKLAFGNGMLSPRGDYIWASFGRQSREGDKSDYGLMEIPLMPAAAVRETVLVRGDSRTEENAAVYFQIGISHDGKTAAVASTYLAIVKKPEEVKPEHCALFFVDLSDPKRKVTTVPIRAPLPRAETGK
jgi:hypothetical protein